MLERSSPEPPTPVKPCQDAPVEIETPHGPARAHLHAGDTAVATMVLGHGAGGGVSAPDLMVAARAALERQVSVALVEQPYVVAGRKSQAPAAQLDAAWVAAIEQLRGDDVPLIVGGRSAGARVACRTANETGAAAVLCLAFPVHPPGRPEKSRLAELDAVTVPTLVVQGERDPFGMPPDAPNRTVVKVAGDHSLKADLEAVAAAIGDWLPAVV
jgi:predicted alpha/beta-hydrolase family hydrolase